MNEELPLSEVSLLAADLQVDAVAVSFSVHYPSRQAKQDLATLRNTLDRNIKLIAGGQAVHRGVRMQNLWICNDLKKIPDICRQCFPGFIQNK
ncbi:hypothetical protein DESUT3_20090 [Desulfuromonas versatilis]|uniref:Uncharacterized protein n=1 Tax=Desulfuromonas versatilis TaxID=2802975 RepID=A0ABN6DXW9_9BACT|nr:hypothetical protein DESUT3_20090 [Desulfuromonas versatilis]